MSIDYSNRPRGMSRTQWRDMSAEERDQIELNQEAQAVVERDKFEQHMLYDDLATEELTWLRNRVLELQKALMDLTL